MTGLERGFAEDAIVNNILEMIDGLQVALASSYRGAADPDMMNGSCGPALFS